jgi:hypothetical protein
MSVTAPSKFYGMPEPDCANGQSLGQRLQPLPANPSMAILPAAGCRNLLRSVVVFYSLQVLYKTEAVVFLFVI